MFLLAGSEPISGDANYAISLEELVDADPEVILLGDAAYGKSAETVGARARLGRDDRGQGRPDRPDRRHRRHATRTHASPTACAR